MRTCGGLCVFVLLGAVWLILPEVFGRRLPPIAFSLLLKGFGIEVCWQRRTRLKGELLLANHVSWTDIPVLGVAVGAAFVAKREVRQWPFIGRLAARYGCLFVDRDRRADAQSQAAALRELLVHRNLILFPEGTTGDGRAILPFRSSLIGAAVREEGRCIPIALSYSWANGQPLGNDGWAMFAWVGDQGLLFHALRLAMAPPIRAEVILCPPIEGNCRKSLARGAEEMISAALRTRRAV